MKATGERRDAGLDRLVERELARSGEPGGACPQVEMLAAWFDRSLAGAEEAGDGQAAIVEAHLATCSRCQQVVAALARSEPETLYVHPRPQPQPAAWHLRWLVPVAAAALVVLAVGNQVLRAPGPSSSSAPVARSLPSAEPARPTQQLAAPAAKPAAPAATAPQPVETLARRQAEPPAAPSPGQPGKAKVEAGRMAETRADKTAPVPADAGAARSEPRGAAAPPASDRPPVLDVNPLEPVQEGRTAGKVTSPLPSQIGTTQARVAKLAVAAPAPNPPGAFAAGGAAGWRYAHPGVVLATRDGGRTWAEQPLPQDARLSHLSAVSSSVCWGAGPRGTIVRTIDGTSWQSIAPPVRADFVAIEATSAARASVRTADGVAYETADAGATWQRR